MKFFLSGDPNDYCDTDDHSDRNQPKEDWKWGYVYLLDSGDSRVFKIGHTKYLIQRLDQLRETPVIMPTESPLRYFVACEVTTNCEYAEHLLHMIFDDHHVNGEWFDLGDSPPELIRLMETLERVSRGGFQYFESWFQYAQQEGMADTFVRYAHPDYRDLLFPMKPRHWLDALPDDDKLLALYENSTADPRLNGGTNKFLKWQANQVQ